MRPTLSPIKITDAAAERVKSLLVKRDQPPAGLRIGVKAKGCSGLSYVVEYADEKGPNDEVVQDKGVTIFIDPRATMFIIGTEVDYVEDKLQSGFVFKNPNEKGRCGCGEFVPRLTALHSRARSIAPVKGPGRFRWSSKPPNQITRQCRRPWTQGPDWLTSVHAPARRHVQYRECRHRPQVPAD